MELKNNKKIHLTGLTTPCLFAMIVADQVANIYGQSLIITSASEFYSKHSYGSLHYSGNAFDMRTRFWDKETIQKVANEIKRRLDYHFDVVIESDHIHIEHQPKCKPD